jgi:HK97 family phage prohead protease
MERRALKTRDEEAPFEFRMEGDGTVHVAGYAAVFNEPADIGGVFTEVIERGAFRSAIERGDDVVFLVNHSGLPLARSSAGNLSLREDERGLRMEATLDGSDPDVARIVPKLRNKLLKAMSFAFNVEPEDQRWGETGDGKSLRTIRNFSYVGDVSIVTTPAYKGTEIALRAKELAEESAEKEQAEHNRLQARARIAARKAESEQKFRGIKPE